jgi:4-amino-4-deoxy-L-arabinose transferase-like glycosyltransferase
MSTNTRPKPSNIEKRAIAVLLLAASLVYVWDLSNNGWGNPYYAAAAQSGAASLKGLIFASSDLSNAITIDKPPLHTAVLALSVWLFGTNPWSVLLPNALLGTACLGLIYATVRRTMGLRFTLLIGIVFIVSPVAVLMFRTNNPDTTMLFLWCLTAFITLRSALHPKTRYYICIGVLIALAFLTKQFQGLILVPAIIAALTNRQEARKPQYWFKLAAALTSAAVPVFAWLVIVDATPPGQRPWIGGSTANSAIELTFGYNGLGRLTGLQTLGAVNPKGYDGVVGADAGVLRLFSPNFAPEISWFLVPAILGCGITVHRLFTRSSHALSRPLEKFMATWFITSFLIVSFMTGNVHPYYTLMLVPPVCFLSVVAVQYLWQGLDTSAGRRLAAMSVMAAAFLSCVFLSRYHDLGPGASGIVAGTGLAASAVLIVKSWWVRWRRIVGPLVAASLMLVPLIFDVATIGTPQQGSFPQSGPVPSTDTWHRRNAEQLATNQRETYALMRGEPVIPDVAELIRQVPTGVLWPGLTVGGENAALYQLETGRSVVAIGGFSGSDNFPSQEIMKYRIAQGEAGYYIHQPGVLKWGPSSKTTGDTVRWILDNCPPIPIEHLTIYDLRKCSI